ncbi:hypothetical protein MTR67_052736 [Solanum verrucosum]|uniref:RNase H type-1 domain-containing protein n=1 Tax=Solanum verrucosum TaxID=315347 RepID=A0AAF0V9R9_SOLVR|nr:hypothetical protein MTR67_052736 [Solanum verrucosum]
MAAKHGMNICCQKNHSNFILELDSLAIVEMINEGKCCNFRLNLIIEELQQLKKHANCWVEHCFREANEVANFLPKFVVNSENGSLYDSYHQLTVGAKGSFQLDKS